MVCTRDRPAELERCLQSLWQLRNPSFEVMVVDNGSSNRSAMELARRYEAEYIYDPIPGLSHARNIGARACDTEIVAYLDDDAVAESGWLEALVAEFNDPEVAAVVGRCVPFKVETEAERLWVQMYGPTWGRENRLVLDRHTPDWFVHAAFGGLGIGANMAFRRRVFEEWRGFDERLGRGMPLDGNEEHYAFLSLARLGYKVVTAPYAIARHSCPATVDAVRTRRLKDRASLGGFFCLLMVEEEGHRLRTLQFLFRKLRSERQGRSQKIAGEKGTFPWRLFFAQLRGPWLYILSNWKARRNGRAAKAFVR